MKHYIELTLLPNVEFSVYTIWQPVYKKIHATISSLKEQDESVNIGVSFPQYNNRLNSLGCKLRLFANSSNSLERLNIGECLSRMSDYVHITSIKPVPDNVQSGVSFYRIRERESNLEKATKTAKRLDISVEQALQKLQGRSEEQSNAPFIRMLSSDKNDTDNKEKHIFKLVIGMKEKPPNSTDECEKFNTYGLSKTATVPWF